MLFSKTDLLELFLFDSRYFCKEVKNTPQTCHFSPDSINLKCPAPKSPYSSGNMLLPRQECHTVLTPTRCREVTLMTAATRMTAILQCRPFLFTLINPIEQE